MSYKEQTTHATLTCKSYSLTTIILISQLKVRKHLQKVVYNHSKTKVEKKNSYQSVTVHIKRKFLFWEKRSKEAEGSKH